jgi:hypothetical protein
MTTLLWQPTSGRFGDWLTEQLQSGKWSQAILVAAFARAGGLGYLRSSLASFRSSGSKCRAWIGIDVGGTSAEALRILLDDVDEVYVVYNPGPSTFHPKLYAFGRGDDWLVAVGSNNLTTGGLYLNVEAAFIQKAGTSLIAELSELLSGIPDNNCKRLDEVLLEQLITSGLVKKEAELPSTQDEPDAIPPPAHVPFTKTPVPPPPRLPTKRAPRPPRETMGETPEAFVLLLGTRDVRQRPGYSREVYVPLAARDAQRAFWGWPDQFTPPSKDTRGTFRERWIQLQIHPVNDVPTSEARRLYYYSERSEFRLNAGPLISGATEGDLLVIERSRQAEVDYDATIVQTGSPAYEQWLAIASETVSSGKRWGYA